MKCRKDSFITHRAFCDALAEESSKPQSLAAPPATDGGARIAAAVSPPSPSPPSTASPPPPPPPPLASEVSLTEDSPPTDVPSLVLPENNPGTWLNPEMAILTVFSIYIYALDANKRYFVLLLPLILDSFFVCYWFLLLSAYDSGLGDWDMNVQELF